MTEYGDPTNKTDFEYLYKYSPLHNVRVPAGSHQYPATMLTTGEQLDSCKLQCQAVQRPLSVLRVNLASGGCTEASAQARLSVWW